MNLETLSIEDLAALRARSSRLSTTASRLPTGITKRNRKAWRCRIVRAAKTLDSAFQAPVKYRDGENEWSGCGYRPGRSSRAIRWRAIASLSVALRSEPRDLAVSVHPLINFGLAGKPRYLARIGSGIIRLDRPVVVGDAQGLKGHFCFCHAVLCRHSSRKGKCRCKARGKSAGRTFHPERQLPWRGAR
jgi:hypothetical protein